MKKIVFFPFPTKNGYGNPYSQNYKESLLPYFKVMDMEYRNHALQSVSLLKRAVLGDIFVFNWIENVGYWTLGKFQFGIVLLALFVIKWRKAKIVWMLHNIHPHQGESKITKFMQKWMFDNSSLIVSHSWDAVNYVNKNTNVCAVYRCHPIKSINIPSNIKVVAPFDILIWGEVHPYKGILEFLSSDFVQNGNYKIIVIGCCSNPNLAQKISSLCNERIFFENRKVCFSELYAYIKACRIVLFPYIGDCVSSSGALIDTIALGGNPVGPNKGAFKDLAKDNLCGVYSSYSEIANFLTNDILSNESERLAFLEQNSWDCFGKFIKDCLME